MGKFLKDKYKFLSDKTIKKSLNPNHTMYEWIVQGVWRMGFNDTVNLIPGSYQNFYNLLVATLQKLIWKSKMQGSYLCLC